MPLYNTRHLQATIEIPNHGGKVLRLGEKFGATDIDANYLIGRKMAVDVAGEPPQAEGAKPPAAPAVGVAAPVAAPAKPGRPPKAAAGKPEAAAPAPVPAAAPKGLDMVMTTASVGVAAEGAPVAVDKADAKVSDKAGSAASDAA